MWTKNVFKPWLCDGRVLFLHLFLSFLYIFTIRWCKCTTLRFQCCLFFLPVMSAVVVWCHRQTAPDGHQPSWSSCCFSINIILQNRTASGSLLPNFLCMLDLKMHLVGLTGFLLKNSCCFWRMLVGSLFLRPLNLPYFGLCVPALALMSCHLFFSTLYWGTELIKGLLSTSWYLFLLHLYKKCTAFCLFVLRKQNRHVCELFGFCMYVNK